MPSMRLIIGMLLCSAITNAANARHSSPDARTILAAAKRATGGAAWDRPHGCIERGTHGDGAITYLTRFSLRGYGMRTDGDRGGNVRSMGFDGKVRWQAAGDQAIVIQADPASLREAVVTNYLSVNGFFFPDRFPATRRYVRSAREGALRFDVLDVTPRGGRALEIWFDAGTHLIRRVIDKQGTPPVRVEASDYRTGPGGLTVAYRLDVFGPNGAIVDRGAVSSFACGPVDEAVFAPPAPR